MTNNFQRIPGTVQKCKGRQLACELKERLTLCYDRPQASLTGVMSCKYLGHKKSLCVCVLMCVCVGMIVCLCMQVNVSVNHIWGGGVGRKEWEGACSLPWLWWMRLSCLCVSVMPSQQPSVTEATTEICKLNNAYGKWRLSYKAPWQVGRSPVSRGAAGPSNVGPS